MVGLIHVWPHVDFPYECLESYKSGLMNVLPHADLALRMLDLDKICSYICLASYMYMFGLTNVWLIQVGFVNF